MKAKLGCDQGMTVNGKVKFTVPNHDPTAKKKEQTVYLTGAHDMKWRMPDLYTILDRELKAAYKGKGLSMKEDVFLQRIDAARQVAMDTARAKADAKETGKEETAK